MSNVSNVSIRRNYRFVQFLLDLFSLFLVYSHISITVSEIALDLANNSLIRAEGLELIQVNPYPIIIWAVVAFLIFAAGIVLPFLFKSRTQLTQKQYDMWVYAVSLIRILALLIVFEIAVKHLKFISLRYEAESLFSFRFLTAGVLIAFLVRFTQVRIKLAAPKETEKEKRTITDN
jgi:uncharacterized membrane protein